MKVSNQGRIHNFSTIKKTSISVRVELVCSSEFQEFPNFLFAEALPRLSAARIFQKFGRFKFIVSIYHRDDCTNIYMTLEFGVSSLSNSCPWKLIVTNSTEICVSISRFCCHAFYPGFNWYFGFTNETIQLAFRKICLWIKTYIYACKFHCFFKHCLDWKIKNLMNRDANSSLWLEEDIVAKSLMEEEWQTCGMLRGALISVLKYIFLLP